MSLGINSNVNSMIVNHNLQKSAGTITKSMQRLSTGLKINSAGDDAAGLNLSEKLESQINASDIAKNNTQTGINLLQVMDSDLAKIGELLQRMRDLGVQSANGVYSGPERTALNAENTQLKNEITRISDNSNFSGLNLLNAAGSITLQVGTNTGADNQITVNTYNSDSTALGIDATTLAVDAATSLAAVTLFDTAIQTVQTNRATIGANINRLQGTMDRTDARKVNLQSANSTLKDTDVATESAALTRSQILQQAAVSMLAQANQLPTLALKLIS